jgi:DNA-binding transcriptional regulator YiaG
MMNIILMILNEGPSSKLLNSLARHIVKQKLHPRIRTDMNAIEGEFNIVVAINEEPDHRGLLNIDKLTDLSVENIEVPELKIIEGVITGSIKEIKAQIKKLGLPEQELRVANKRVNGEVVKYTKIKLNVTDDCQYYLKILSSQTETFYANGYIWYPQDDGSREGYKLPSGNVHHIQDLALSVYEAALKQKSDYDAGVIRFRDGSTLDFRGIVLYPEELRARLDPSRKWGKNWKQQLFKKLVGLNSLERVVVNASGNIIDAEDRMVTSLLDCRPSKDAFIVGVSYEYYERLSSKSHYYYSPRLTAISNYYDWSNSQKRLGHYLYREKRKKENSFSCNGKGGHGYKAETWAKRSKSDDIEADLAVLNRDIGIKVSKTASGNIQISMPLEIEEKMKDILSIIGIHTEGHSMSSQEFKEERIKRGFTTQKSLADAFGVSRKSVSRWESGKEEIPISRVNHLLLWDVKVPAKTKKGT